MEFRILGPLEVVDGGRVLAVQGIKQRALLVDLLLHANEFVSGDRLIDDIWADDPPESGLNALRVRVSQLRKALGDAGALVETGTSGYALRVGPEQLDLYRFEGLVRAASAADQGQAAELLRQALALWRGPPLAEFAYETFAQPAIGRLEELRLAALERRIEADLALGLHEELVGELVELIAAHPVRERLRGQLMLALYRSGRQAEALKAYQATRRALVEGLGLEPTPALQAIQRAILRQAPELDLAQPQTSEPALLVVSQDASTLKPALAVAEPLAREPTKELILLRLLRNGDSLEAEAATLEACRADLVQRGLSARAAVFVSTEQGADVVRLATEQDVDLVILTASAELLEDPFLEAVLSAAPCDVAVVAGMAEGWKVASVLVPFIGAEHDWAAVELGARLASALGVTLILAGPREVTGARDASRLLASASLAVQRANGVAAQPRLLDARPDALISAADEAGLAIVGLTDRWHKEGLGSMRHALATRSRSTVVLVRRGLRPGGLAPREALTRFTWSLRS